MNLENMVNGYLLNLSSPLSIKDRLFLDKILSFKIAFNRPHGIEIRELSTDHCRTYLPYKKSNTNHLGGMHACVLALVGEYSAGLMILRNTGLKDFRIILKELQVEYAKQAKGEVYGEASLSTEEQQKLKAAKDKIELIIETKIKDQENNLIAAAKTTWQIKAWEKVQFK